MSGQSRKDRYMSRTGREVSWQSTIVPFFSYIFLSFFLDYRHDSKEVASQATHHWAWNELKARGNSMESCLTLFESKEHCRYSIRLLFELGLAFGHFPWG